MKISFTSMVFKEGGMYVAFTPEIDVSSCGKTPAEAKRNLLEAVNLFIEETRQMNTLEDILTEVGYTKTGEDHWKPPNLISTEKTELTTPA